MEKSLTIVEKFFIPNQLGILQCTRDEKLETIARRVEMVLNRNGKILDIRNLYRSCHTTKAELLAAVRKFSHRFEIRNEKYVHLLA